MRKLMILPRKHILLQESIFGFGAYLLSCLNKPITVDELWNKYRSDYLTSRYKVNFLFDDYVIALDYLFLIGAININAEGMLSYETN